MALCKQAGKSFRFPTWEIKAKSYPKSENIRGVVCDREVKVGGLEDP